MGIGVDVVDIDVADVNVVVGLHVDTDRYR